MDKYTCKAKRIDDGKWVSGLLCYNIYGQLCIQPIGDCNCCVIDTNTICRHTGMTEFVMTDKSVCAPLFEGDIVEINSLRRPYAAWPQSKYDGEVKARAVIYFERGMWMLNYDNPYNNKMCEPRGNEQYERSVDGALDLYYFGYNGKPDREDWYREHNPLYKREDIVRIGNIYDNPELLEVQNNEV